MKQSYVTNPGVFLENYVLGKELGKGNFGVVYEACRSWDPVKTPFAVKVISLKGEKTEHLHNEVRLLSSVRSSHIVQMIETFQDSASFYMVMELVTGGEMLDMLTRQQHYSERDARHAFSHVMQALNVLRHHHIVHRDVKPDNLLLCKPTADSDVKLADFGLAAQVPPGTRLFDGVGTPNYIAPEVLKCLEDEDDEEDEEDDDNDNDEDGEKKESDQEKPFKLRRNGYDSMADMWSAGCILYILLSGQGPFQHTSSEDLYDSIMGGKYKLEGSTWEDVSSEAKDLVCRLLCLDDSKRIRPEEVLVHPWMKTETLSTQHRDKAQQEMRAFNAKRRWKSSILAVVASNSFKTMLDMQKVVDLRASIKEK